MNIPILRSRAFLLGLALLACALAYGAWQLLFVRSEEQMTDDAFVSADYTVLSPKVGGIVQQVLVEDNQAVKAGQLLVRIDDRDYQAAVASARADVAGAEAQLGNARGTLQRQQSVIEQATTLVEANLAEQKLAKQELERSQHLAGQGAGSVQNAQQAQSRFDVSQARVAQNRAALVSARKQTEILQAQQGAAEAALLRARAGLQRAGLDLSHTQLLAPIDGVIGRRAVRVGALVNPGASLMAVVPLNRTFVVANLQETQLTHVRRGQSASITVDAYPGAPLRGTVHSIAPATGVTFAAIAPENATGNFTKVVQRIPVRIALDPGQDGDSRLRVGMSAEVRIDTAIRYQNPQQVSQVSAR
ncbi:HlyD family secretion protein [Janthinobacterium sp. 1_2014MBL_MicDiv]|uniref:HlyD family secretion protein n=1 Tax=Janthinobacterium sp. 1_2014MBL_MicDiv TaxID=1644131 RepID=UPI0008F49429|nr:HlyD family secretion protein [Janthinobacterium sp. 1_2014MBL_MicDiv]APA69552.1 DSBA oxidoreductase [Janthinobacterium sp. 1_2014MBL_MicDiv]